MMGQRIIAISGGIGAGKSLISTILRNMGHNVYDCDSNAKIIMDESQKIKEYIIDNISVNAVVNNKINRSILANIIFKNNTQLNKLNTIVHYEVKRDIYRWINNHYNNKLLFIETAILYQSGIDKLVNEVWEVTAPLEMRINRVMIRNNLTRQNVIDRINAQNIRIERIHPYIHMINNDEKKAILPQIIELL